MRRGTKRPRFSVGGHPVYENDDSSNQSGLGVIDYDDNSLSQPPETSTNSSDQHHFPQNQFVPDRSRRVQRASIKPSNEDNTNLTACLDHLFNILSQKDREGFFQYPVTDQLAPGYSQIITRPMDFSTIRKKIAQDGYSNILEFRTDFELMCENALKYNRPETIYWQAAKKLSATGAKLMSKEKLLVFRRTLDSFTRLTEREFGFPPNDEQSLANNEPMEVSSNDQEHSSTTARPSKVVMKLPRYYEKLSTLLADEEDDEDVSPEEILSQAQQAAHCAREKLSLRRPMSAYTLSSQRTNGTTSLRFLNQDDLSHQQSQTRIITIGELSNLPSSAGAPSSSAYHPQPTAIVNESEKRNHLLPRYFLDYGPFSSHAPQYDSSFTSICKDDLDQLIHTYGSEFSAQNAVSMIDYVKDSGDLALGHVDRFLSLLTNGEGDHLVLKRKEKVNGHPENGTEIIRMQSLDDLCLIDLALSNGAVHLFPPDSTHGNAQQQFDMKLDENAKLLVQLRQTQYDRLCPPSNRVHQIIPAQPPATSESLNEYELAEKVLTNLTDLTHLSSTGPEQVISPAAVRHNLGIVANQESTTTTTNIIETL